MEGPLRTAIVLPESVDDVVEVEDDEELGIALGRGLDGPISKYP